MVAGVLAAGLGAFAPAGSADPGHPPDAVRSAITVNAGGQCLHPTRIVNNARLSLGQCDGRYSNTWDIIYVTDHQYFIRVSGSNKCLTAPSWADYYAVLYECGYYADQLWYNDTVAVEAPVRWMVKFRNVAHGKCLVGPWWAPNTALAYQCLDYDDQEWWVQLI